VYPDFLPPDITNALTELSQNPLNTPIPHNSHHTMLLYGDAPPNSRLTYSWSKGKHTIDAITTPEPVQTALDYVLTTLDLPENPYGDFNTCLHNFFPTGRNRTPKHRDTRQDSGDPDYVLMIALGSPRPFVFTPTDPSLGPATTITLTPGTLLVISTSCNQQYSHLRPMVPSLLSPAFSLTFRHTPLTNTLTENTQIVMPNQFDTLLSDDEI